MFRWMARAIEPEEPDLPKAPSSDDEGTCAWGPCSVKVEEPMFTCGWDHYGRWQAAELEKRWTA